VNPIEEHVVNLATGTLTTVRSFAETAATVLGLKHEQLLFGAVANHYTEMEHDEVSIDRLHHLTGWTPETSVAEGIRQASARELALSQAAKTVTVHSIG